MASQIHRAMSLSLGLLLVFRTNSEYARWWTIPLTTISAYFMIGMELVAEHVEEPFGTDEDDLDLDLEGMCNTIELSVNGIFTRRSLSHSTS